MRHVRPASFVIALLSAAGVAHADGGYAGGGIGPGAGLDGDIASAFATDDSMNARILIGQRMGPAALEASLFGAGMVGRGEFAGEGTEYDTVSLGVDVKYFFGIAGPLELYPKLGLNKTWLTGGRDQFDYDGIGWDLGLGLQYNIDRVGIWLDLTHQRTNLRDDNRALPNRQLDGSLTLLSLGVSVGF